MEDKPKPVLIFSGTKGFGISLETKLRRDFPDKIIKFISADNNLSDRSKWIQAFVNLEVDILISTTILAWGVNLPARRVIVAHTSFGIQNMPICDVQQMIGRSGRPKFDKQGDAYVLLDENNFKTTKYAIENGENIESQFGKLDVLQFHTIAEICNKNIVMSSDFHSWYSRSLAYTQDITPASPDAVMSELERYRCISLEDSLITPKPLGFISFWFYYPPRVIYQLYINIQMFKEHFTSRDEYKGVPIRDIAISMAFNWLISDQSYVSKEERGRILDFQHLVKSSLRNFRDNSDKLHGTYKDAFNMLNKISGRQTHSPMSQDFGRLVQSASTICNMVMKDDLKSVFEAVGIRYQYGVKEELVSLVSVKGVGRVSAVSLFEAGILNHQDLADDRNKGIIIKALGSLKRAMTIIRNAKES